MARLFIIGLICLFALQSVWAKTEVRYFKVGNNIVLRPPGAHTNLKRVMWKLNENLVAEWSEDGLEVEIYPAFKSRTKLDTNTGVLVISSTTANDAGEYTVEINDKLLEDGYKFVAIEEVPDPSVWVKPGETDDDRTLSCEGDVTKAGPVEFYWNIGLAENEPWIKSADHRFTLTNNETTKHIEFIYCKMVNPIGQKKSPPKENPFYSPGTFVGAVVGIVVMLLLVILAVVAVVVKRKEIKQRLCPDAPDAPDAPAGDCAVKPENVPLNTPEGGGG